MRNEPQQLPAKRYSLGPVETYEVPRTDFDRIETEASSIGTGMAFACACLPVALALTVTLATVDIPAWSEKGTFILLTFGFYIAGLYFSVVAYRQRGHLRNLMNALRDRQVAPLGEKGDELGASQLDTLPSEKAEQAQ